MNEAARPEPASVPRIEYLRVRNFRALRDLELRNLTPLTAFIGPNGSGKSTIFDVFAFLHEAFTTSLRQAVENRYGMRELRTRGESGPIEINLRINFGDDNDNATLAYEIEFNEEAEALVVFKERATCVGMLGEPANERIAFLSRGEGWTIEGGGTQVPVLLRNPDELAAPLFGRVGSNNWFLELLSLVVGWYISDIEATDVRTIPGAGPQQRLSPKADNVANVMEWLTERHPERLKTIDSKLREWVPRLESIRPAETGDGRFMLQLKDAPFERAIPARYASEGTLKLLAYLTALYGQDTPTLMGFEEPEDSLPPQLLYPLADEFRRAAGRSQVFVNTHSPAILNALRPDEVRMLYRDERGFTQAVRVTDLRGVNEAMEEGAALGSLWSQGFLRVGDPTKNAGMPSPGSGA